MTPGLQRFVAQAEQLKAQIGHEAYYAILGSFGFEHPNQVPLRERHKLIAAWTEIRDDGNGELGVPEEGEEQLESSGDLFGSQNVHGQKPTKAEALA